MEVIPDHPLIKLKYSEVESIRKCMGANYNVKTINESIDDILEWAKKQEHLADAVVYMGRNYLERILVLAVGSVATAKNKIEKLCTTRGLMSDLCLNQTLDEHDKFLEAVNVLPLPSLSPNDYTRVILTKFLSENVDDFTITSFYRYCFLLAEYRLQYDYFIGERLLIDLKNVKLSLISKINPIILKKGETVTEAYGTKIKGIHLINAPPFVDKLVFVLKSVLKEKLANRIHVHSTYEDLYKHIPKEILPKDYGGDEVSCDKLAEQWREVLRSREAREYIAQAEKRVSDDSKRNSVKFNEEYMGMPGSFRRLNVD